MVVGVHAGRAVERDGLAGDDAVLGGAGIGERVVVRCEGHEERRSRRLLAPAVGDDELDADETTIGSRGDEGGGGGRRIGDGHRRTGDLRPGVAGDRITLGVGRLRAVELHGGARRGNGGGPGDHGLRGLVGLNRDRHCRGDGHARVVGDRQAEVELGVGLVAGGLEGGLERGGAGDGDAVGDDVTVRVIIDLGPLVGHRPTLGVGGGARQRHGLPRCRLRRGRRGGDGRQGVRGRGHRHRRGTGGAVGVGHGHPEVEDRLGEPVGRLEGGAGGVGGAERHEVLTGGGVPVAVDLHPGVGHRVPVGVGAVGGDGDRGASRRRVGRGRGRHGGGAVGVDVHRHVVGRLDTELVGDCHPEVERVGGELALNREGRRGTRGARERHDTVVAAERGAGLTGLGPAVGERGHPFGVGCPCRQGDRVTGVGRVG